jgi:hypothetical protein
VDPQESSYEVSLPPTPQTAVTVIEMDAVVKQRIAENVVNSIATLKSLAQLVMDIPNMVVLDHIRTEVRRKCIFEGDHVINSLVDDNRFNCHSTR